MFIFDVTSRQQVFLIMNLIFEMLCCWFDACEGYRTVQCPELAPVEHMLPTL